MEENTINLIYENSAVGSLAVVDFNGGIIENHLPTAENELAVIINTVININKGFSAAGREIKGFAFQTESVSLMISFFTDFLIITEIIEPNAFNRVEKHLRSVLSTPATSPITSAVATDEAQEVVQEPQPVVQTQQPVTPVVAEPAADEIDFMAYRASLVKLMKKVAAGGLAEKMVNAGIESNGIDPYASGIDRKTALKVGMDVIGKIPNKSRRKILEKEFSNLSKSF